MVDLSKHLARAKQAIEKRNYELAIEISLECQEVDPANLDNYRLLIDAAKRWARERGKKGLGGFGMSLSKDPHKQLSATVKKVSRAPDVKSFLAAGDAAMKIFDAGTKSMLDVALLFYEEGRATGLFHKDLLWNTGHAYYAKYQQTQEQESLERALANLRELEKADPTNAEASRTIKNWEAMRSMARRHEQGTDYRSQLSSDRQAQRNEIMNRLIRTREDAQAVLDFVAADLADNPEDKALWVKKGDVHRRIGQYAEAREAYENAQRIDPHDFVVTMRLGDLAIQEQQARIQAMKKAGQDTDEAEAQLLELEIGEYRKRIQRAPTEMEHQYQLGIRLFRKGDIDGAAAAFQQAVKDPRFRRQAYNYMGHCFAKKGILDLARNQFSESLKLIEDTLSDEYKDVLYNRGRVSEALGDKGAAEEDFIKVVELDLGYRDTADRLNALRSSS